MERASSVKYVLSTYPFRPDLKGLTRFYTYIIFVNVNQSLSLLILVIARSNN